MGFNKNNYSKLHGNATRADRNAATLDELIEASRKLQTVAQDVTDAHDYLATEVQSLKESVRLLTGESDYPADYYRNQLVGSFEKAAEDIDFYGFSKSALNNMTEGANKVIKASNVAMQNLEDRFGKVALQHYVSFLSRAFAAASIILALSAAALVGTVLWKMSPVFTGNAVVSYTQEYESELDKTKLDLALTQNELEAYKSQYPNGIGETAQTDLNNANRAVQEAYDQEHGG